jgi:hypothetical protein
MRTVLISLESHPPPPIPTCREDRGRPKKNADASASAFVSYFLLKIGTVLQGSPYMMLLATGINFFVMAR